MADSLEFTSTTQHRDSILLRRLIVCVIFLGFAPLFTAEFSWYDDPETLHQNPAMNPPSFWTVGHYWVAFGKNAPQQLYIPLTYMVWGAIAKVAYLKQADNFDIHLNPLPFHAANVILHTLSALVVFELLKTLFCSGRRPGAAGEGGHYSARFRDWSAAAGALLFALHPLQVEPVAWVSGMKDVLYGLLSLIAIWQYVEHAMRPEGSTRISWNYIFATLAFAAALFAKPTAIVTPLMAVALDRWLIKRSWRIIFKDLSLWFVLAIPCIIWTRLAQPAPGVEPAPVWARPFIATDSILFYLQKIVWPMGLAVDYGRKPQVVMQNGWLWATAGGLAAILAVVFLLRKHREVLVSGAIFVTGVIPVLGFIPFSFQNHSGVADHYLYLSMLGPAIVFAWILNRWRQANMTSIVILIVLAGISFRQAGFWRDDATLFAHTLQINPKSFMALNNHGAAMLRNGEIEQAERDFRQAVELNPRDALSHENLGLALMSRQANSEAGQELRQALELDPNSSSAREKLRVLESRN